MAVLTRPTASKILSGLRARTVAADVSAYACIPLIEEDSQLMKLAIAWRKVRPQGLTAERLGMMCPQMTPRDLEVRWLWALVEPDPLPRWIEVAGLPYAPHVIRACNVLIDHEAVLPDGTLSVIVEQYIQRKVGAFLQNMVPRRRPQATQPELAQPAQGGD